MILNLSTNIVWVSTTPRTGSMWLFNVTREIYRGAGRKVEPEIIPKSDKEMAQTARFAVISQDPEKVWVLKVHKILNQNLPNSKIITTHRDPRDILISFKEFMKSDFNRALNCARDIVRYTEIYQNYDSDYLMLVAYNDIETHPLELILKIAKFLRITISKDNAKKIALKFSREKVKKIIENTDKVLTDKIASKKPIDKREIVIFSKSNYRAFDLKTGFQSGHISQRKTGDWKSVLSESEQDQLNNEFGDWLTKYGYEK